MKIGDKVKLLETYIVCHDTFISEINLVLLRVTSVEIQ